MKLVREKTQDCGELSKRYRGNVWLFYIHDNDPERLEAVENYMDNKESGDLTETRTPHTWGDDSDHCPCYEDGFGSGYWIDIESVSLFKEHFKEARKTIKAKK